MIRNGLVVRLRNVSVSRDYSPLTGVNSKRLGYSYQSTKVTHDHDHHPHGVVVAVETSPSNPTSRTDAIPVSTTGAPEGLSPIYDEGTRSSRNPQLFNYPATATGGRTSPRRSAARSVFHDPVRQAQAREQASHTRPHTTTDDYLSNLGSSAASFATSYGEQTSRNSAFETQHHHSSSIQNRRDEEGGGSIRKSRQFPLKDPQEACLFRYFVEELSHWVPFPPPLSLVPSELRKTHMQE